jgi:hypothetical protein
VFPVAPPGSPRVLSCATVSCSPRTVSQHRRPTRNFQDSNILNGQAGVDTESAFRTLDDQVMVGLMSR